jgi:hypothetical protein
LAIGCAAAWAGVGPESSPVTDAAAAAAGEPGAPTSKLLMLPSAFLITTFGFPPCCCGSFGPSSPFRFRVLFRPELVDGNCGGGSEEEESEGIGSVPGGGFGFRPFPCGPAFAAVFVASFGFPPLTTGLTPLTGPESRLRSFTFAFAASFFAFLAAWPAFFWRRYAISGATAFSPVAAAGSASTVPERLGIVAFGSLRASMNAL